MRGPILAAALAAGCVPRARYAELESSYDRAVAEREQARREADEATRALDEVRARDLQEAEASESVLAVLREAQAAGLGELRSGERTELWLPADALFAAGTAELTPEGARRVAELADALDALERPLRIEGHPGADERPSREFPTAWHLGADRAIRVVLALIEGGVPAERLTAASVPDDEGGIAIVVD